MVTVTISARFFFLDVLLRVPFYGKEVYLSLALEH
jgi:hypothetical protein